MKNIKKFTVAFLLLIMMASLIFGVRLLSSFVNNTDDYVKTNVDTANDNEILNLPILMYHNIIDNKYKESKYEITVNSLESDLKWLSANGFTAVNTQMLKDYVKTGNLPKKVVMLTFDDGFYSYLKYLPALMEKYDMRCLVGVVGEFTKFNKNTTAVEKYKYLDYDDIAELAKSSRIEVANHTYNNHRISNGFKGIAQRSGESIEEYRNRMSEDIVNLENELGKYDLHMACYVYPYGLYSKESENIIKSFNYQMSLTCAEKINKIGRTEKDLYLLGRFNRSHTRSAEEIINKYYK